MPMLTLDWCGLRIAWRCPGLAMNAVHGARGALDVR